MIKHAHLQHVPFLMQSIKLQNEFLALKLKLLFHYIIQVIAANKFKFGNIFPQLAMT